MVAGIANRKKRYVEVVASFSEDGRITPLAIKWEDGRTFSIDYIREARSATSLKVGGTGYRYLVTILGTDTYLFYENPRWFVEEKVVEMP
ncbi:MAG: hypothetical protein FWD43_05390 [Coriobacteriia bacterium]|nr:hypothetical protein [Coriobacteriia bacterium]